MLRIAIAGLLQESLTFSPAKSYADDFFVYRGQELIDYFDLKSTANRLDIELVPVLTTRSTAASGSTLKEVHLQFKQQILDGLKAAMPFDGVCLALHGAQYVDGIGSAEEDLVMAIRELVGPDMLIAARYDQHANLTLAQVEALNIITIFRTAPHRDWQTRYHDTLELLVKALQEDKTPRSVFIRIPMLIVGEQSTNVTQPIKGLIEQAVAYSSEPGILNTDVIVGFAWADAPIVGMGVVVTAGSAESLPKARQILNELARKVWHKRKEFEINGEWTPDIDTAIQKAQAAAERTIFISDSGDNITAGSPGDVTCFLSRLLEMNVQDVVYAGLVDRDATRACFDKQVGDNIMLEVGAKMDSYFSKPVTITGKILNLYTPAEMEKRSRMATLQVQGITLVLTELRWAFRKLEDFEHARIDPLGHKIVVVKTGYLFPEIVDIAPRSILAITPGYTTMDYRLLPYKHLVRPIFPLDIFEWDPEAGVQ